MSRLKAGTESGVRVRSEQAEDDWSPRVGESGQWAGAGSGRERAASHLELHLVLRHVHGALKELTALSGDHLGERLGVESRVGEAQAAVH